MAKTRDLKTTIEAAEAASEDFYRTREVYRDTYDRNKRENDKNKREHAGYSKYDPRLHKPDALKKAINKIFDELQDSKSETAEQKNFKEALYKLEQSCDIAYHNITGGIPNQYERIKGALVDVEEKIKSLPNPSEPKTQDEKNQQEFFAKQQAALKSLNEKVLEDMEFLRKKAEAEKNNITTRLNVEESVGLLPNIQKAGGYGAADPNDWWVPDWADQVPPKNEITAALTLSSDGEEKIESLKKFRETKASVYKSPNTRYKIVYDEKTGSAYHASMMDPLMAAKLGMYGGSKETAEKYFVAGWKRVIEFLLLKKGPPINLGLDPEVVSKMTESTKRDYLRYLLAVAEHASYNLGVKIVLDDFTRQQISIVMATRSDENFIAQCNRLLKTIDARDTEVLNLKQETQENMLRTGDAKAREERAMKEHANASAEQKFRPEVPVRMPLHEHMDNLGKAKNVLEEAKNKFEKLKDVDAKVKTAVDNNEANVEELKKERVFFTVDAAKEGLKKLDEYFNQLDAAKQEFERKINDMRDPKLIQEQILILKAHTEELVRRYESYSSEFSHDHYKKPAANSSDFEDLKKNADAKITEVSKFYAEKLAAGLEHKYEGAAKLPLEDRVKKCIADASKVARDNTPPEHLEFEIIAGIQRMERAQKVLEEDNANGAKANTDLLKNFLQKGYGSLLKKIEVHDAAHPGVDTGQKKNLEALRDKLEQVGVNLDAFKPISSASAP